MFYSLIDTAKKLNMSESDVLTYRSLGIIKYSPKTDKYDIDSVLEKRTMTIPLYKYLSKEEETKVISYMKAFSSFKFKLFSDLQKGIVYENSGTNRKHRTMTKLYHPDFDTVIADSALSSSLGIYKSSETWLNKTISNLEKQIVSIRNDLEEIKELQKNKKWHPKFLKGKKKKLSFLENRLAQYQSKKYLPVHFGKKSLKETIGLSKKKIQDRYRKARMELSIDGSAANKGNSKVRIEYNKSNTGYQLKFFDKIIPDIKIYNSHKDTFTLSGYNKQAIRISYNSNGKIVLHITYSYIKPIPISKYKNSKGCVGIDIGPKEIAVSFVKNDGNPAHYYHYNIGDIIDSRSVDRYRKLSLIIDDVLDTAISQGFYQVAIENLEFKDNYKYKSKKLNRLLSKFPHTKFDELITSKCKRKGLILKKVNPAYTSIIGIFKYSNRDNLQISHNANSKDLSAALVIGRRGLGFHEKAIISVRVLKHPRGTTEIVSMKIKSLLTESEKEVSTFKSKKHSNWSLWNKIGKLSYLDLTGQISANCT